MKEVLMVEPHTELEVRDFAKDVGITNEQAGYIENMRAHYLCREFDYYKEAPEVE